MGECSEVPFDAKPVALHWRRDASNSGCLIQSTEHTVLCSPSFLYHVSALDFVGPSLTSLIAAAMAPWRSRWNSTFQFVLNVLYVYAV